MLLNDILRVAQHVIQDIFQYRSLKLCFISLLTFALFIQCAELRASAAEPKETSPASIELRLVDANGPGGVREVPIQVNLPDSRENCTERTPCSVVMLSGGYGESHLGYQFLVRALQADGFLVICVVHDLPGDAPVATQGNLVQLRLPVWRRGRANLEFVRNTLASGYASYDWRKVILIGHSQGGDISALIATENPDFVASLITLDHRRMPLPRSRSLPTLSLRATDYAADQGVLPNDEERRIYPISVIRLEGAKHNELSDRGGEEVKQNIKKHVLSFLRENQQKLAKQSIETSTPNQQESACFILVELGKGEIQRWPSQVCSMPLSPASTFKIPHALAALEAGVISGSDELIRFNGQGNWPKSSRRDHTLASAIQHSVVWYFQSVAERMGAAREQHYLDLFNFGNRDIRSGLTSFWLGGSLKISPEQQLAFYLKLFKNELPASNANVKALQQMMLQPQDKVLNAFGAHPFNAPWPPDALVRAKTGSTTDESGKDVRWLVGHVTRAGKQYIFVSCVVGSSELNARAAIQLAANGLRKAGVL